MSPAIAPETTNLDATFAGPVVVLSYTLLASANDSVGVTGRGEIVTTLPAPAVNPVIAEPETRVLLWMV